jgi:hypothetical protein
MRAETRRWGSFHNCSPQQSAIELPSQTSSVARRGFWYLAHFRHGARLCITSKFGAGIGGLGSYAAEPFAVLALNDSVLWLRRTKRDYLPPLS